MVGTPNYGNSLVSVWTCDQDRSAGFTVKMVCEIEQADGSLFTGTLMQNGRFVEAVLFAQKLIPVEPLVTGRGGSSIPLPVTKGERSVPG